MKSVKKFFTSGNLFTGAVILAAAGIICRLLGVVIRIPLANIVGNFGMGLYQMVFPLYSLLLIISSAGVPVAISKMVAKEKTSNNRQECKRILMNAVVLLGIIGAVVSTLFMVFAYQIASVQGNRDVGVIYLAIAPSVMLVCIISAFRGYFQGLQNMVPTAASQIIEQVFKVAAGITMALIFIKISTVWAVFGAILAITISETAALLFLVILYLIHNKKNKTHEAKTQPAAKSQPANISQPAKSADKAQHAKPAGQDKTVSFPLMWSILKQSAPVTLMASVFPLVLVLDSMLIINMLVKSGLANQEATQLYGISSGSVHTLINLPAVLAASVAAAVVPAVSSLLKQEKMDELRDKMQKAVKITLLITIFFTAFYVAFADKILDLLYHGAFKNNAEHFKLAVNLLRLESVLILLMGISSVFTAMLQGAGKAKFPLISLVAGAAVKVILELILIKTPMGIYAVSFGNVVCFCIASIMNTIFALRHIKIKKKVSSAATRLVFLSAIFLFAVLAIARFMPANRWWVLLSGTIALIIYAILVALFGFLSFNNSNVVNKINIQQGQKEKN